MKRIYRSQEDKKIAGILGGLGELFDIDPTLLEAFVCFHRVGYRDYSPYCRLSRRLDHHSQRQEPRAEKIACPLCLALTTIPILPKLWAGATCRPSIWEAAASHTRNEFGVNSSIFDFPS